MPRSMPRSRWRFHWQTLVRQLWRNRMLSWYQAVRPESVGALSPHSSTPGPSASTSTSTVFSTVGAARVSGQVIAGDGHTEGLSNWLDK